MKSRLLIPSFFLLIAFLFVIFTYVTRALVAFSTIKTIQWDETYYMNIAVTGGHGLGLYPYIQNYDPTPIMGGVGYAAYLYVAAVKLFGSTILSLRLISYLFSLSALIPIYLVHRLLYGSATAVAAIAIVPMATLFVITNTARFDSPTFAYVSWALLLVIWSQEIGKRLKWHFLAGLVFGLGLQVHLHTTVSACACGVLYLVDYFKRARNERKRLFFIDPLWAYIAGYGLSFTVFLVFNVFQDVEGFLYASSVRAIVMDLYGVTPQGLLETLFSPQFLLFKEINRYAWLFRTTPVSELLLMGVALIALFVRRDRPDRRIIVLYTATLISSIWILNWNSVAYTAHTAPILLLTLPPLITHGFKGCSPIHWRAISFVSVVALLLVGAGLFCWSVLGSPLGSERSDDPVEVQELAQKVAAMTTTDCILAGDQLLYIAYFTEYPRFNSTGKIEIEWGIGVPHPDTDSQIALWERRRPDLIFGELNEALEIYIDQANYLEVEPNIWIKSSELSEGCLIDTSS